MKRHNFNWVLTDINASELARRMGVGVSHMSQTLNKNRNIQISTVKKMADSFDMKVSEFIALGED